MIFEELLLNTYLVKYYKNIWEEWMTNDPCMELLEPENPSIGYRAQYIHPNLDLVKLDLVNNSI